MDEKNKKESDEVDIAKATHDRNLTVCFIGFHFYFLLLLRLIFIILFYAFDRRGLQITMKNEISARF